MTITRRKFVVGSAATAATATFASLGRALPTSHAPQHILILGGTGFIGPHLVRHAVDRGHTVTIFTRGRRIADLPASVERLVGDRDGKLDALRGRRWDAVIDDSATNPDWVRQSAELLATSGRYLFTSSTGVYYPYLTRGLAEQDPVHTEARDANDGSESYGTRKAQCEAIVQRVFGERGLVVRPTYIVGPGDTTDRFTYWPVRLARGGDTLAPGKPEDPVQFIDVRDLTPFMIRLIESGASGVFNALGPSSPMTISEFLTVAMEAIGSTSTLTWVDDYEFLATHKIVGAVPWILPTGNNLGHTAIRSTRSAAAGLSHRAVESTVRDTLAWFRTLPEERQTGARWVMSPEQEAELLSAWRRTR